MEADRLSPAAPSPPPTPPPTPPKRRGSGGGLLLNLALAAAALAGIISLQWTQLHRPPQQASNPKQAEQLEGLRVQLLKQMPAFGFNNAIANWAFLNYIQYFGDEEARAKTGYSLNAGYFDLITQRDPRFVDMYLFLSTGISYYLGEPQLAVQYMDRGTRALSPQINPRAYLVWRWKGLDQLLLINDIPGSIHSHEMAAKWVEGTPDRQYAPVYRQTAEFLKTDPDSTLARGRSWAEVYINATDKRVRERAKQEILKLGGQIRQTPDGQIEFVFPTGKPPKKK
ncbi:MAG: hypothetical protein KME26_12995 [Oscillatoria princeps RMCB-10]|nr:hypothetical protein [Oscillatoria princeps RMCB-10]